MHNSSEDKVSFLKSLHLHLQVEVLSSTSLIRHDSKLRVPFVFLRENQAHVVVRSWSNLSLLREPTLSSTGTVASYPYASENEVSLVIDLAVVI